MRKPENRSQISHFSHFCCVEIKMWIAHYAPGLVAKVFAPQVPLSLLTFAGEANDALFFVLNFLGLESFSVNPVYEHTGCFPYSTNYPFSHSLLGMFLVGIGLATAYSSFSNRPVTIREKLAIVLCSLSHFILEWPAHREDVKVMPMDDTAIGRGWFDAPVLLFVVETTIFFTGLFVYSSYAPLSVRAGYKRNPNWMRAVIGFFLFQQAQFCFSS